MEAYGNIAKDVLPRRVELEAAQATLAGKEAALAAAQLQMQQVLAQVNMLKVRLSCHLGCWKMKRWYCSEV